MAFGLRNEVGATRAHPPLSDALSPLAAEWVRKLDWRL